MNDTHNEAVEQLQALLGEQHYAPDRLAEIAIHALYPKLSEGAFNTFSQLGRGAILMDLRELASGKLNTSYLSQPMVKHMNAEVELFDDAVRAVREYDPLSEFVTIVLQDALITTFKLDRL